MKNISYYFGLYLIQLLQLIHNSMFSSVKREYMEDDYVERGKNVF